MFKKLVQNKKRVQPSGTDRPCDRHIIWAADQAFEMSLYFNFALVLSLWKQQLQKQSENYTHIALEKHNLHLSFLLVIAHVSPLAEM